MSPGSYIKTAETILDLADKGQRLYSRLFPKEKEYRPKLVEYRRKFFSRKGKRYYRRRYRRGRKNSRKYRKTTKPVWTGKASPRFYYSKQNQNGSIGPNLGYQNKIAAGAILGLASIFGRPRFA